MDIAKSRNFLLKEEFSTPLDEMAKIQGGLKDAIDAIIAANPEVDGLPLKKLIRADQTVLDLLDGDSIYDNQLNKYIATFRGERTLQPRGRKSPNSAAKTDIANDLDTSTGSLEKLLSMDDEVGVSYSPEEEQEPEEELPIDNWNTPDEEDVIDDEGPRRGDIDTSLEKEIPSDTTTANSMKNIISKKVSKIENAANDEIYKREMAVLKQYIQKPEVKKTLGKDIIRDLVSSIIG